MSITLSQHDDWQNCRQNPDVCKEFVLFCACWHNNVLSLLNYGVVYCDRTGRQNFSFMTVAKALSSLVTWFYCFHIFGEYVMVLRIVVCPIWSVNLVQLFFLFTFCYDSLEFSIFILVVHNPRMLAMSWCFI